MNFSNSRNLHICQNPYMSKRSVNQKCCKISIYVKILGFFGRLRRIFKGSTLCIFSPTRISLYVKKWSKSQVFQISIYVKIHICQNLLYKDYAIFINYQQLLHQISAPQAKILRFLHSEMMISIAKSIENSVQIPNFPPPAGSSDRQLEPPPPCSKSWKKQGGGFLPSRVIP